MELRELVQVLPKENIVVVDIGVNEADFGRVAGIAKDSADDLEHGGDTSTASNHAYMFAETRGIDEIALGALEAHNVTDFERGHDARDISFFVGLAKIRNRSGGEIFWEKDLDEEVKTPGVIVAADGGVAASDEFAIDLGGDGDVLANGEAEYVEHAGQLEAVTGRGYETDEREDRWRDIHGGVGGDDDLLLEGELQPLCGVEGLALGWARQREGACAEKRAYRSG